MADERETLPLLAAMTAYCKEQCVPFHTPGHKYGRGMHPALARLFSKEALAMDVSLMHELDDLFSPDGCIKAAQDRAARLYGAGQSFFIVNGTTAAIHAMLLATVRAGDKVLIELSSTAERSLRQDDIVLEHGVDVRLDVFGCAPASRAVFNSLPELLPVFGLHIYQKLEK